MITMMAPVRAALSPAARAAVEAKIGRLMDEAMAWIALLDAADGDADMEDGDEDCCGAQDDDPAGKWPSPLPLPWQEEDREEDGGGLDVPHYSADQRIAFADAGEAFGWHVDDARRIIVRHNVPY